MRLLVVEDEAKLASLLARGLGDEGFAVDVAADGATGRWFASEHHYDAIVLDVMLPDTDGFTWCAQLRADECWSPVLMLTARDAVSDRVRGLDAGADDYLPKPFDFDELTARLRALVRRSPSPRPVVIEAAGLRMDPAARTVHRGEHAIALSSREYALLECFMRHPGQVMTRAQLMASVWDFAFESDSNVVDVYVRYLREKIDRPFAVESIATVRGVGYRLREDAPG